MTPLDRFSTDQLEVVNEAVALAEELVSDHFKLSASQWRQRRYDVKTAVTLNPEEITHGPFAQIIRYVGRPRNDALGSSHYDFYTICLQDHAILAALAECTRLSLYPFLLYIVTHELIHVVRFSQFLQSFEASAADKLVEETRVHATTYQILVSRPVTGMAAVLEFYAHWRRPLETFTG